MLLRGLPLDYSVGIVTSHNDAKVERWRSELSPEHYVRVGIMNDLDALLGDPATQAVIVANRSPMHGETAGRVLAANKHVFVEKPFTLDLEQACSLVKQAKDRNLTLVVGLEYLFATYLRSLHKLIALSRVRHVSLDWFDPVVEFRHGGEKRRDPYTSIFHDILPHVWSILRVLTQAEATQTRGVAVRGLQVELELSIVDTEVVVRMDRHAERRLRRISIDMTEGGNVQLDFTIEPGRAILDGVRQEECQDWKRMPSPVAGELRAFRDAITSGIEPVHAASLCIDSVRLAVEAESMAPPMAVQVC
jgi:predicted dehydrogenase